ncbi:MAG: hypothetical protein EHM91_08150, partial [Planctomycetota bacterium]
MRIALAVLFLPLALDASPRPEGAAADAAVPAFGGHGLVSRVQDEKKHFDPAVHEATKTFAYGEFLIVPVRVHILQCEKADALHCRLKEDDVRRVFGKANRIWNKAGIAFHLESIVTEEAVHTDDFNPSLLESFKATRPPKSAVSGMIHVFYV